MVITDDHENAKKEYTDKPWWEKEHVIMSGPKSKPRSTEKDEPIEHPSTPDEEPPKPNLITDDERKKRLEAIEARLSKQQR
jgi:hypothetical protein